MIITSTKNSAASAQTITTTTPAAAASGKRLYFFYHQDTNNGLITAAPTGATEVVGLTAYGTTGARYAVYKLALAGAPDADYTVTTSGSASNIALIIVCVDGDGDSFTSDTWVTGASASSDTATTGTATNAGGVSAFIAMFGNDSSFTISTAPSTMTLQQWADMDSSELAVYSEIGFATGTRSLVWSGTDDWIAAGMVVEYAASGPEIVDEPGAETVILSNETSASFSVTATGTGTLLYDWELEDGVGSGVYANLANGNGATWTGQTASSCTATLTAKTLSGRRVRCNVTDDNGTTTSTAVALTLFDGPQVTTFPATNGSGVSTATLTCDYVTGVGEAIEVRIPLSDGDVAVTVTTT